MQEDKRERNNYSDLSAYCFYSHTNAHTHTQENIFLQQSFGGGRDNEPERQAQEICAYTGKQASKHASSTYFLYTFFFCSLDAATTACLALLNALFFTIFFALFLLLHIIFFCFFFRSRRPRVMHFH